MNRKDVFLSRYPESGNRHAYIVICKRDRKCVLVNFTTKRPGCDEACVVQPGEHSFVRHESVVEYRKALLVSEVEATYIDKTKVSRRYEPVTDELLRRIQEGALRSRFAARNIKALIKRELESV